MGRISLPFKVTVLMALAVALVSAAGYLAYKNLSSIVASVEVKSRPDLRLLTIRDIAASLDKAENSVRLYRLTRKRQDLRPYYAVISGIDDKIDSLRAASIGDTAILAQIDTIGSLIEESMMVWNEMTGLYHSDSLESYIHSITAKIAVGTLNNKVPETSILKRVFKRKAIKEEEARQQEEAQQQQQKLIHDVTNELSKIERQDSIKNSVMLATESRLAATGNKIRERLYILITKMENEVIASIRANSEAAQKLAKETYERLAVFAVLASLLVLIVLVVVSRYVRKTREYQKALEFSREETEKLAKTKERFVANMSHEIRTPVNAIYGFTGQLMHEPLNEKSRKMLGIVHSTSEHLLQVVNDVLDFSKLQNDAIVLDRIHFMLQPVFEEISMLFAGNVKGNNSQFHYNISRALPPVLYGDCHRLKQILFNLVGNAVKFTSDGEIRLSASSGELSGNTFDLVLTVSDTGIGISKDMQEKVFDDFTQAEAGTSRKYGGTGLGLSIVRKLVDLHEGDIRLESHVGKGTTIVCKLPYQAGDIGLIKESAGTITVPEFVRKLKVLIVDDEEYNRLLFKTIFTRWQVYSEEATDGEGAMEKISSSSFDIIFMDARMPGLSGLEASSKIREQIGPDERRLQIVGTSATHSVEDMQIYLAAGMNAFLPKPFTEKMLLDTILTITGQEQFKTAIPQAGHVQDQSELSSIYRLANNDVSFVKQLLDTFIQSTEKGLNGLEDAISTKDLQSVRDIAHRISSPCRHVGARQLYSRLKMIEEQAGNHENIGILAELSRDSITEFLEIKKGLQKHLETL